ncbi:MAG: hypothetical protein LBQ88_04785 [Treponema sp.]|jgi:hypothetical protein|nr:hypothetical protein [Treponema sp.]
MGNFFVLYTALTIFGLGVTVIDFLGFLDHAGEQDTSGGDESADTGDHTDGGVDTGGGHDDGYHAGDDYIPDHTGRANDSFRHGEAGALLGSGNTGIRFITRLMGLLRTAVYFSLGAGPTGLFAFFTGRSALSSLLWAGAAGAGLAVLGKILRKLIRNDIDSSIKSEEMLMETAVISVPVGPGQIGKAIVRQFGREREVYVRCKDEKASFAKGSGVRIVDYDEHQFWIE